MRSMSESKLGKITASRWFPFEEDNVQFRLNIMQRETYNQIKEEYSTKTEYVILIESPEHPRSIISTEFGPTCGICLTSDYIKIDKTGTWFDAQSQGCTCTRCGSGTLY